MVNEAPGITPLKMKTIKHKRLLMVSGVIVLIVLIGLALMYFTKSFLFTESAKPATTQQDGAVPTNTNLEMNYGVSSSVSSDINNKADADYQKAQK